MGLRLRHILVAAVGSFCLASPTWAVTLNASSWIDADDPIKENQSGVSETGNGHVYIHGNGDLAVVTDYTVTGGFDFSGNVFSPTDDDILGWLFGYVDGQTNYRISWTGGEDHDWEPGGRYGGLLLIEENEQEDITDILFHDPDLMWTAGIEYAFSLSTMDTEISFELRQEQTVLADFSVLGDFADISGAVGVFTRSNGTHFYNLDDEPLAPLVATPLPGGLPLLLGGAGILWFTKRRRTA